MGIKVVIVALSLLVGVLWAEDGAVSPQKKSDQVEKVADAPQEQEWNITADSMDMMMDSHVIEMEGNVVVEDATVRLTARKMIVHLDENNKMKDIEAHGNVTVHKLDSSESATGDTGRYDAATETVTLSGNCILMKDKTTLTGDKVVYNRKTNVIGMKRATITLPVKKGESKGWNGLLGGKQEGTSSQKGDAAGSEKRK